MPIKKQCYYSFEDGKRCPEKPSTSSKFCFFHNRKASKSSVQARNKIIKAIQLGKKLEGAHLEKTDLSEADLKGAILTRAYLNGANLKRVHLEKAHLYGAHLQNTNLFNAHLQSANLKETTLTNANLLEIKLDQAKLLGIHWGANKKIKNETEADQFAQKNKSNKAKEKYREAEEIYRNLRLHLNAAGLFEEASDFLYRELVVRRKQLPLYSCKRFISKVIDLLCGYGEKTARVLICALSLIFFISFIYFFSHLRFGEKILGYTSNQTLKENVFEYSQCLYFSVVSFTTRGFGDITPFGLSRIFASIEAFLGAFMIALFVLTFVRKMIR